ncbi:MAG: iron-containing alcohol dehydrogenase, partial [Bacillota bacterium]
MAYAEYVAGMAFSNAGLGMVHAMAHSLGGKYNLPHGICNAVLLPYVMRFNGKEKAIGKDFKKIAAALQIPNAGHLTENKAVAKSIEYIAHLSKEIGITQNLKELKADPKDFESLGTLACKDACMQDNPIIPSKEEVVRVYEEAYRGSI